MRSRAGGAIVLLALSLLAAGCTASSNGARSGEPSTPPVSVPPATSSAPVSSATASTSPSSSSPTSSAAPTTSPVSASPTSSSTTQPVAFATTCTDLMVMVIKGGAIRGAEIAAMQFTNTGSTTCTITGTPTAQLLRNGAEIGSSSQPNGDRVRPFTLQPGDVGESLLRDFSTCNAPLSDKLRVRLPALGGKPGRNVTAPIMLRACTLQAAPVGAPA